MSLLLIMTMIVVILVLLALIGLAFYIASEKFGFWGVLYIILGVAVLIGAIVFTSYVTINLGDIKCGYNAKITELNRTSGKNYTVQRAFHSCSFDFFGTKSDGKTFFIQNS